MHPSITIKKTEIEEQFKDDWDYLYLFLDKYFELWNSDPEKVLENFTHEQISLLAYTKLDAEVYNGGFIQLIYNGYGAFIFDSPLIENLEKWGLTDTLNLLVEVSKIYEETKISQQQKDTLQDFSDLYTKYPQFEKFDDKYYQIKDDDVKLVKKFVEQNTDKFAILI